MFKLKTRWIRISNRLSVYKLVFTKLTLHKQTKRFASLGKKYFYSNFKQGHWVSIEESSIHLFYFLLTLMLNANTWYSVFALMVGIFFPLKQFSQFRHYFPSRVSDCEISIESNAPQQCCWGCFDIKRENRDPKCMKRSNNWDWQRHEKSETAPNSCWNVVFDHSSDKTNHLKSPAHHRWSIREAYLI